MLRYMLRTGCVAAASLIIAVCALAQTPQPFPRPGERGTQKPSTPAPPPETQPPAAQQPAVAQTLPADQPPSEAVLGAPVYPRAQFIASYNAGHGQRYYLFGTSMDFNSIVAYYRTVLKQKGELVYEEPPVHMFDTAKFKEETMAFPPSVTIKDYAWGGSQGYLNPKRGAEPQRFKTIIQIVPPPTGSDLP